MMNVKDKHCPCGKRACFGDPLDKIAKFCKTCKVENMINVKDPMCNCGKQASFGDPMLRKRTKCKNCKTDGMINLIYKKM